MPLHIERRSTLPNCHGVGIWTILQIRQIDALASLVEHAIAVDNRRNEHTHQTETRDNRQRVAVLSVVQCVSFRLDLRPTHDHKQEQHNDGAGINDDLYGRQKMRLLSDEQDRNTKKSQNKTQRRVHWMLSYDHANGSQQNH